VAARECDGGPVEIAGGGEELRLVPAAVTHEVDRDLAPDSIGGSGHSLVDARRARAGIGGGRGCAGDQQVEPCEESEQHPWRPLPGDLPRIALLVALGEPVKLRFGQAAEDAVIRALGLA